MASTSTNGTAAITTTSLQLCIQAGGGRHPISVETALSIAELKQKIEEMTDIPRERQRWVVPPSGPITVKNNGDRIGSVLQHKSTLHVQDCSLSAGRLDTQEPFEGHQWRATTVNGTDLHQGDTIDSGFYGQVPQGRGTHMFGDTRSEYGALKQGDQYQARNTFRHTQKRGEEYSSGGSAPSQNPDSRCDDSLPNGGANAGSRQHRGNRYEQTSTQNTSRGRGDVIQNGWHGSAPKNGGNHRFEVTVSKGGSLHQGNKFRQSALVGNGISTSENVDKPST